MEAIIISTAHQVVWWPEYGMGEELLPTETSHKISGVETGLSRGGGQSVQERQRKGRGKISDR